MNAIKTFLRRLTLADARDALLELRIKRAERRLLAAHPDDRKECGEAFTALIRQRSANQVARMEKQKGLI